uniref:Non-specific lipid-transfer protein 2 n=1 Tax=Rhizophora mucronata TaxID=61149 RepID=A0A2P2KVB0_RHIMU
MNSSMASLPGTPFLSQILVRKKKKQKGKKERNKMKVSGFAVYMMLVMVLIEARVSQAATCNPSLLMRPCLEAFSSPTPPSSLCCSRLNEQKPCYCGYLKDPNFSGYVSSPGGKRVVAACKVPLPKC